MDNPQSAESEKPDELLGLQLRHRRVEAGVLGLLLDVEAGVLGDDHSDRCLEPRRFALIDGVAQCVECDSHGSAIGVVECQSTADRDLLLDALGAVDISPTVAVIFSVLFHRFALHRLRKPLNI